MTTSTKHTSQSTFLMLQDVAQQSLDKAMVELKKAEEAYCFAQDQLNELNNYYGEYQERLTAALLNGVNKQTFSNFQFFMSTVEKSIEQQKQVLAVLTVKRTKALQSVYQCQKKVNAYRSLIERKQKFLIRQENRLQQKQIDEFAHQQSVRKSVYECEYR